MLQHLKGSLAVTVFSLVVLLAVVFNASAAEWKFEDAKIGELPKGWSAEKTGEGAGSVWKVLDDATAPSGSKVLAQTSSDGKGMLFNLCVAAEPKMADVEINRRWLALNQ